MQGIILTLHSYWRWVVVALAVVAIIRFAISWLRRAPENGMDRALMPAFAGALDLQTLLGITYFIWDGLARNIWPLYRIEHAGTMLIAVAIAHIGTRRWRRAANPIRARNYLLVVVVVFLLIGAGTSRLPQGWFG